MAKTVKKPRVRKATTADIVRLGQATADLKARTPPKQWAQIVNNAHARGFTLAGALSGNPDPLKERTQSSLKTQAQSTVDTAYKPAYDDNDAQQTRLKAWDVKRTTDNHAYEEWVQNQLANLKSQGDAADAQLRDAAHAATAQTAAGWVSPENQAAPDGSGKPKAMDLAPWAAAGTAAAANAEQRAASITGIFANTRPLMQAGAVASQAALTAAAHGEITKALAGVIDDRSKLTISKASDYVKGLTDLQGKEISKASSNRDYQTVVSQLEQAGAKIAQDPDAPDSVNEYGYTNAAWKLLTPEQRVQAMGDTTAAVHPVKDDSGDVNQYGYTKGQWAKFTPKKRQQIMADVKNGGKGGPKGKSPYLPTASQNVAGAKIDKAVVAVKGLKDHYTEQQVRALLLTGRPAATGKNSAGDTVHVPAIPAVDKADLNVAMDIAYRGGISATNVNYLHKHGIKVKGLGYNILPRGAKNTRPATVTPGPAGFPQVNPATP